jgi:hypothetical protein
MLLQYLFLLENFEALQLRLGALIALLLLSIVAFLELCLTLAPAFQR